MEQTVEQAVQQLEDLGYYDNDKEYETALEGLKQLVKTTQTQQLSALVSQLAASSAKYLSKNLPRASIQHLSFALVLDPTNANLFTKRSEAEQYNESLVDAESALALTPSLADGFLRKGNALFNLGQTQEALDVFRQGLQVNVAHDDLLDMYFELNSMLRQQQHDLDENQAPEHDQKPFRVDLDIIGPPSTVDFVNQFTRNGTKRVELLAMEVDVYLNVILLENLHEVRPRAAAVVVCFETEDSTAIDSLVRKIRTDRLQKYRLQNDLVLFHAVRLLQQGQDSELQPSAAITEADITDSTLISDKEHIEYIFRRALVPILISRFAPEIPAFSASAIQPSKHVHNSTIGKLKHKLFHR